MREFKRVAFLLVFVLFVNIFGIYSTAAYTFEENAYSKESADKYIRKVAEVFLYANNKTADKISEGIPVVTQNVGNVTHYIYFLFNNGKCVGYINLYDSGTGYNSNYVASEVKVSEGDEVAIVEHNDELLLVKNDTVLHMAGLYNDLSLSDQDYNDYDKFTCDVNDYYQENEPNRNAVYYYLDLPYVANSSVGGTGICWAACIASRVNYNNSTSYTNWFRSIY